MTPTLQIHRDGFIHNGTEYNFSAVISLIYQPATDRVIFTTRQGVEYRVARIQCEHTSALVLAYARWRNNQVES